MGFFAQRPTKVHCTGCVDLSVLDTSRLKSVYDRAYRMPFRSGAARVWRVIAERDGRVNTGFMQAMSATCGHANLAQPERSHAERYPVGGMGNNPQHGTPTSRSRRCLTRPHAQPLQALVYRRRRTVSAFDRWLGAQGLFNPIEMPATMHRTPQEARLPTPFDLRHHLR